MGRRFNRRRCPALWGGKKSFSLGSQGIADVAVSPYDSIVEAAGNAGGGVYTTREFINFAHYHRVRQTGTITKVRLYCADKTNVDAIYIKIWRKTGTTYDLVGTSNNIIAGMVNATTTTHTLSTPITGVQEGDFYGIRIEKAAGVQHILTAGARSNATIYYADVVTDEDFDWEAQSSTASAAVPIILYMGLAPHFVAIGDSLVVGANGHHSYCYTGASPSTDMTYPFLPQLAALIGGSVIYQNMGLGSNTTTQGVARFTADVVNASPTYAIIEPSIADISEDGIQAGDVTTVTDNYTTMLNACVAAGIIPIVLLTNPVTAAGNYDVTVGGITVDSAALTITRELGSWVDDGVKVLDWITMSGYYASIDSYAKVNQNSFGTMKSTGSTAFAQSMTGDGEPLQALYFYLRKVGSPTGDIVAKLYTHSGVFGTSSVPTGAALATSVAVSAASLTTTATLYRFVFSSPYTLVNGTKYCVSVEFSGGDNSNYVQPGYDTTAPTHGGNLSYYAAAVWTAAAADMCFYALKTGGTNNKQVRVDTRTATVITCKAGTVLDDQDATDIRFYAPQMETLDLVRAAVTTLVLSSYPTAILVDPRPYVGKYRSGGPAGNYWDIQTAYDDDGVHLLKAGYGAMAQAIYDALKSA